MDKIILIPTSINQKKVTDLMENCPGLRDFFNSLEKRDKKYLISSSSIIEMSSKVKNNYSYLNKIIGFNCKNKHKWIFNIYFKRSINFL